MGPIIKSHQVVDLSGILVGKIQAHVIIFKQRLEFAGDGISCQQIKTVAVLLVCLSFNVFTPEEDFAIIVAGTKTVPGSGDEFAIRSNFPVVIESREGNGADGIDVDAAGQVFVFVVILGVDTVTVVKTN